MKGKPGEETGQGFRSPLRFAVRFNMVHPFVSDFSVDLGSKTDDRSVSFTLLSLPIYWAGQLDPLIREQYSTGGKVNNHQLKAGGIKTGGLNRQLKENTAESRWF